MTPFQGTERFVHRQCLGSGSFGSVYEVFDQERQTLVALKVPHESTAKSLFLFKKEFRALADVSHPNLVGFHELVSDDTQWFFTMELVEGTDILRYLRHTRKEPGSEGINDSTSDPVLDTTPPTIPQVSLSNGFASSMDEKDSSLRLPMPDELPPASAPQDYLLVTRTFKQLAEGLIAIHQAGLLHRDIKPSNVLVTPEGRVVLLDFGLSAEIESSNPGLDQASEITGTPAYMAPEQLLDNKCSEASDWYSAGVLLYHVLTGRLPFQGNGLRVLINKVSQHPAAPSSLLPGIPPDISGLCMELLHPSPEERPSGFEFLRRLEQSETTASSIRKPAPLNQEFIGREWELETLFHAFQSLREGRPGWINLHGGSGMGKSYLIRKFRREILKQYPEALVLSGRCYEQEHVPYKALDGLVDELSQHLRHLPANRIETLLPHHTCALAQLFPVFKQVPQITQRQKRNAPILDPQELRHRAFSALRELLRRIGENHPLVLIIDDLQWGDSDSTILLTDLLDPPNAPIMLFVACYRTEESGTSPVLREFLSLGRSAQGRSVEIPLKELDADQAGLLARRLLNQEDPEPGEVIAWIVRESGGNPFFIHELAQHAALRRQAELSSENLESYIHARVTDLPSETRSLLELTALAGYPLEWQILKTAAGIKTSGVQSLDLLRQGHLIRIRAVEKRRMIETYHDFIRNAVVSSLPLGTARAGHLRIAQALEEAPKPDVQALALHYQAAGETGKAIDYLTTAGLQASRSLAFARAASLFRMALSLRSADDPESFSTWKHLGEALANAGRGKEAAEAYLRAAAHAVPQESNILRRQAAQEYLRNGHFQEGIGALENVLSSIGDRLAKTPTQALFSAFYHRCVLWLRGLRFTERKANEISQETLDRLDAYWVITMGLATGDLMRVADFQTRQLLLSLQTGELFRLVRTLAYEAIFCSSLGRRGGKRTTTYLNMAMILAQRAGDPYSMSHTLIATGIARTALGQWRQAAAILDKVEMQLRENATGLAYELRNAQSYALINHYALGNLAVLASRLPVLFREAEEAGDLLFLANLKTGSGFIHFLAKDSPDTARQEIQQIMKRLPDSGFFHQRALELVALGNIDLYCGNPKASWDLTMARWDLLIRSRLMSVQAIRITCLELRARLALALAGTTQEPKARRDYLRTSKKDTASIQREQIDYGQALALRLETIAAWLDGRTDDALGFAFLAESAFEASEMALHANVMKRCRGLLRGESGLPLVREADEWMKRQGVVAPARMMAMYLPGMNLETRVTARP